MCQHRGKTSGSSRCLYSCTAYRIRTKKFIYPKATPETFKNTRKTSRNEVEQRETRKNSTVAREFEIAFPSELNQEQRLAMLE
ncbi:nickase, partial [Staphylococcus aureus]